MWKYNNTDELYHYGILGMRWGHHTAKSAQVSSNKSAYKQAKKEYRKASTKSSLSNLAQLFTASNEYSTKGANKNAAKRTARNTAYANKAVKEAIYKSSKKNSDKSAARKELKVYTKAIKKAGIVNSYADRASGGKSTATYNAIKKQKGKAYADKVNQRAANQKKAAFATSALISVGMLAAEAYSANRS